jgi:hypothetical protein
LGVLETSLIAGSAGLLAAEAEPGAVPPQQAAPSARVTSVLRALRAMTTAAIIWTATTVQRA